MAVFFLKKEDNDFLLQENGDKLILEEDPIILTRSSNLETTLLNDNFDDNSLDTSKWNNYGGGNVVETNQRLEITSGTTVSDWGVTSQGTFDFTNGVAQIRLLDTGNQSIPGYYVFFTLGSGSNNALWFAIGNNSINTYRSVGGVQSLLIGRSYSSTYHQYLRIREEDGLIYFEVSSDGQDGNWNEFHKLSTPFAITSVYFVIGVGLWQAESVTTTALFDDFVLFKQVVNTTAQLTPPSGKTAGSHFDAGKAASDTNILQPVNLGENKYTELEWTIQATDAAAGGEIYEFRVVSTDGVLEIYSVYPECEIVSTQTFFTSKSLGYAVKTSASSSKSLRYAIKTTPSAVSKQLHYLTKKSFSVSTNLVYKVKSFQSLSKQTKYTVKTTPAAINRQLRYTVRKAGQVGKSLQYFVKKNYSFGKQIRYTAKTAGQLSKSLRFAVAKAQAISKNLQYKAKPSISVSKSLRYAIRNTSQFTSKSLKYTVKTTPASVSRQLYYTVKSVAQTGRALKYSIGKTYQPDKQVRYTIKKTYSPSKTLQYLVTKTQAISKNLQYKAKPSISVSKFSKYVVRATSSPIAKQILYFVKTTPFPVGRSVRYTVRKASSVSKTLKYTAVAPSSSSRTLRYLVKTTSGSGKTLKYTLKFSRSTQKQLKYEIFTGVTTHHIGKSLKYSVCVIDNSVYPKWIFVDGDLAMNVTGKHYTRV